MKKFLKNLLFISLIFLMFSFFLSIYFLNNVLYSILIILPFLIPIFIILRKLIILKNPPVIWITGLPSSGKTTLAIELKNKLTRKGYIVEHLDGDKIREIFPETGFTREERNNHIKRTGFLAYMLQKHGILVIASFVSPYNESRNFVRNLCSNFIEVYLSTPLEICENRDDKGLYARARKGEIVNFTGVSDVYEIPEKPDLTLDTSKLSVEDCVKIILKNFF